MVGERKLSFKRVTSLCVGILTLAPAALAETYITFDVSGTFHDTRPTSINLNGTVTGNWAPGDIHNRALGFVRDPRGAITTFNVGTGSTYPTSINNKGAITGSVVAAGGNESEGFVRAPDGTITTFVAPGANLTYAQAINAEGTITGNYGVANGASHGFVRHPDLMISSFDASGSGDTYPTCINERGVVAGYYLDPTGQHGFVREPGGKIIPFDGPGSKTQVTGINVHGTITGYYQPASTGAGAFGFVRDPVGHFTSFDPSVVTEPHSINANGTVTGQFARPSPFAGFVRTPDGAITAFQSVACHPLLPPVTLPESINDLGVIAGACLTTETSFGNAVNYYLRFVRLP
jgi:hypothetical protein